MAEEARGRRIGKSEPIDGRAGPPVEIRLDGKRLDDPLVQSRLMSDSSSSSSDDEAWEAISSSFEATLQAVLEGGDDEESSEQLLALGDAGGDESDDAEDQEAEKAKEKAPRSKRTKAKGSKERKEKTTRKRSGTGSEEAKKRKTKSSEGYQGKVQATKKNSSSDDRKGSGAGSTSPRKDTQSKKSMLRFLRSGIRSSSVGHYKKKQAWSRMWEGSDLDDKENMRKIILLQSAWRRTLARRLKKKLMIANELLNTEENYVRSLSLVCNSFYFPLLMLEERKTPLLPADDVNAIFSVIGKMYEHQQSFLSALKQRITDWRDFEKRSVGDIFLEKTGFFDLYTAYINNYDSSMATLRRCKQENKHFQQYIAKCESAEECEYQDLGSFLIQPIQRIPRYVLLLADLMRKTSKGSPTYRQLSKAVQKMRDMTSYFNEQKRDAENADYVDRLYERFIFPSSSSSRPSGRKGGSPFAPVREGDRKHNPLLADSKKRRRFVREGEAILIKREKNMGGNVIMKKPSGGKRGRERRVVLFNDLLVLCSPIRLGTPASPAASSPDGSPSASESRTKSFRHSINLADWSLFLPRKESREESPLLSPRQRGSTVNLQNSGRVPAQGNSGGEPGSGGRNRRKTVVEATPKPKGSPNMSAQSAPLKVKEVEELWKIQAVVGLPESYGENVFQIKSFKYTYLMAAKTAKEKEEWMNIIHTTRERLYRGTTADALFPSLHLIASSIQVLKRTRWPLTFPLA